MQPYHTEQPDRRIASLRRALPDWKQRYFWNGTLDMLYIFQCFTDSLQTLQQLDPHALTEPELSLFFKAHIAPILDGIGSCREQGGDSGELRIVCMGCQTLIHLRVWADEASRKGWIQQLEQDMDRSWIEEGYLVFFHFGPAGPMFQGWLPKSETNQRIYEIGIAYGEGL